MYSKLMYTNILCTQTLSTQMTYVLQPKVPHVYVLEPRVHQCIMHSDI